MKDRRSRCQWQSRERDLHSPAIIVGRLSRPDHLPNPHLHHPTKSFSIITRMSRQFFVGGNFKMNPATREQKKGIVKILNDADVDPTTGDRTVLPPSLCKTDCTFKRSSSRLQRCTFSLSQKRCAKISRSQRKTLTSRARVHSLAR